ncbi:MAG: hypothetical protein GY821_06710 [Gammaproteobacteria bacterium]|nr:hypothetical protein [Gammaproteobacteria bacterium]
MVVASGFVTDTALSHSSFFDSTSSDNTIDTDALKSSDKKHKTYEEPKYYWAKTFKAKLEEQLKERLGVDHDNANSLIDQNVDPKTYHQAVADAYDASLKDPKMVERLKDYGCTDKEFGQILVDGKESHQLVQDMGIPQLADLKPSQGSDNIIDDQQDNIPHSFSNFGY